MPVKIPCCRRFIFDISVSGDAGTGHIVNSRTAPSRNPIPRPIWNTLEPKKNPQGLDRPWGLLPQFILANSPAHEGISLNSPGRSSGSWLVLLPAPSHLKDVLREPLFVFARPYLAFNDSQTTVNVSRTVAFAGFVPIYSGGTARDSHPLPIPRNHNVEGTLGDQEEGCQVH